MKDRRFHDVSDHGWLEIVTTASDFSPYHRGVHQNHKVTISANIRIEKSDKIAEFHRETHYLLGVTFSCYLNTEDM